MSHCLRIWPIIFAIYIVCFTSLRLDGQLFCNVGVFLGDACWCNWWPAFLKSNYAPQNFILSSCKFLCFIPEGNSCVCNVGCVLFHFVDMVLKFNLARLELVFKFAVIRALPMLRSELVVPNRLCLSHVWDLNVHCSLLFFHVVLKLLGLSNSCIYGSRFGIIQHLTLESGVKLWLELAVFHQSWPLRFLLIHLVVRYGFQLFWLRNRSLFLDKDLFRHCSRLWIESSLVHEALSTWLSVWWARLPVLWTRLPVHMATWNFRTHISDFFEDGS